MRISSWNVSLVYLWPKLIRLRVTLEPLALGPVRLVFAAAAVAFAGGRMPSPAVLRVLRRWRRICCCCCCCCCATAIATPAMDAVTAAAVDTFFLISFLLPPVLPFPPFHHCCLPALEGQALLRGIPVQARAGRVKGKAGPQHTPDWAASTWTPAGRDGPSRN